MPEIAIPPGLQTRKCLIGDGVINEIPALMREIWPNDNLPARIVADENTWRVAGKALSEILERHNIPQLPPYIFPITPPLHAEYPYVEKLREPLTGCRPIAVGSGTINDLVKRTTFELQTNGYLCCATACSVDGYTAAGAAITKDGMKQTLPCPAPLVIVADNTILRTAPFDMTAAGYADLAAKVPAGGDWFIAEAVGATPMNDVAWKLVQTDLKQWLDNPQNLSAGDMKAFEFLFQGLCATGFAMQYMQDSRPASGAEHLFSHVWEMQDIRKDGIQPSHGFKVAVGSLITTAMMEVIFQRMELQDLRKLVASKPQLTRQIRSAQLDKYLGGTPFEEGARAVSLAKFLTGDELQERQNCLFEKYEHLRNTLKKQLLPFEDLKQRFKLLGCPTSLQDIGLTPAAILPTAYAAGMLRNRYTILDVLTDLNIYEEVCQVVASEYLNC